ncbi:MAG: hypothetical protein HRT36_06095 [Alphaproteobacteria bacterium]|nr:hypothetical protein [Alphaproteobacteria bacterium]
MKPPVKSGRMPKVRTARDNWNGHECFMPWCSMPNRSRVWSHLPPKGQFISREAYYSTALHELGYATGHKTRLKRDLSGGFGSQRYAREELRAEIGSYMLNTNA